MAVAVEAAEEDAGALAVVARLGHGGDQTLVVRRRDDRVAAPVGHPPLARERTEEVVTGDAVHRGRVGVDAGGHRDDAVRQGRQARCGAVPRPGMPWPSEGEWIWFTPLPP